MKKNLLIAISLIAIVTSCTSKVDTTFRIEGNVDTKNGPHPAIWYTDQINFNGDSLYYINSDSSRVDIAPPYEILVNEEKHFDCIVESCESDGCAVVGSFVKLANGNTHLPSKSDKFKKYENGSITVTSIY